MIQGCDFSLPTKSSTDDASVCDVQRPVQRFMVQLTKYMSKRYDEKKNTN